MAKARGKRGGKKRRGKKRRKKKGKKQRKGEKVIVLEYLVDAGSKQLIRLIKNRDEWLLDNALLRGQLEDELAAELEATIVALRRQEAEERRACLEALQEQDERLAQADVLLQSEHAQQTAEIDELTEELTRVDQETCDVEEQVLYWRNYPHVQSIQNKAIMKGLKAEIRHVDELYNEFEEQLDGNFRYMHSNLMSEHAERLEKAKQAAARWRLGLLRLSDHSELSAQETLCLQSVLLHGHRGDLRDKLDSVFEDNMNLKRKLVPMRVPEDYPKGVVESDHALWKIVRAPRHLHLEDLIELLSSSRLTAEQAALIAEVRDRTLEALHPDEEELRARKLAARAAATAAKRRQSAVLVKTTRSEHTDTESVAESTCSQLLPFEAPLQPKERSVAKRLKAFERFRPGPHWWRVHVPQLKPRTWPVTEPLLAEYAERPAVYDLEAGDKVIFEEESDTSTHVSDEWRAAKLGREEHLAQRSALSITPPQSEDTSEEVGGEGEDEEQEGTTTSKLEGTEDETESSVWSSRSGLTSARSARSSRSRPAGSARKWGKRSSEGVKSWRSTTSSAHKTGSRALVGQAKASLPSGVGKMTSGMVRGQAISSKTVAIKSSTTIQDETLELEDILPVCGRSTKVCHLCI